MKRYCLTVDLKDDPALIRAYEDYHKQVWPEILQSLTDSGIESMEIYRLHTRMFMIIETSDDFSFEKKSALDLSNPKVQEWEKLMGKYQQALP
jgi:L-rhamnose mutarotase